MKPINAKRERGAALLALLAVIMLGASWFLVNQLNAESGGMTAVKRTRNAEVLNRAKQALIGYVAQEAATNRNPGRLPCPEHAWYIGISDKEGIMGPSVGVPNPGIGSSDCASIGRLPWRTLGLDKLVDADAEPLWYVVGPAWRLTDSDSLLTINSNSPGGITIDGEQVVALIIAPGKAMNVQASAGCTLGNQSRGAPAPAMVASDYLECFNSLPPPLLQFVTGPASSYNDQVVRITTAEVMPAIEAVIADRIKREIVPILSSVYTPANWVQFFLVATPPLTVSAANPLYPFAAPFANPTTSNYQGAAGQTMGLLPFNQMVGCNPATDPRCTTTLIAWPLGTPTTYKASGYGYIQGTPNCSYVGDVAECQGEYHEDDSFTTGTMRIEMSVTINNVLGGMRTIMVNAAALASKMSVEARNDEAVPPPWQPQPHTYTYTINTNGSITFTFGATLPNIDSQPPSPPGWGTFAQFRIRFDKSSIFGDHALLNPVDPVPSTNCPATGCTGWFVRNEWYRLLYYAVAPGHTAAAFPSAPSCTTGTTCLSVANVTPTNSQNAILILGGRSVNGNSRPSATLADYLESGNATGAFTSKTISASAAIPVAQRFNDRIVVIGPN